MFRACLLLLVLAGPVGRAQDGVAGGGPGAAAFLEALAAGDVAWSPAVQARVVAVGRDGPEGLRRQAWQVGLARALAAAQSGGEALDAGFLTQALASGHSAPLLFEAALRAVLDAPVTDAAGLRLLAQIELISPDANPEGPPAERARRARDRLQRLDPVAATAPNERLLDHVVRLGHALHAYGWDEAPTGLDDRGEVWVRYGPPDRVRTVSFDEGGLLREARELGIHVARADFPENEVWLYDALSAQGVFLFVAQRRGEYRLGDTNALIPRALRTRGLNASPRSRGYTQVGLMTLRYVLSQLALFHPSYSNRYAQVGNYVSYVEESAISARADRRGVPRTPAIAGFDRDARAGYQEAVNRNEVEDAGIAAAREATMPAEASEASAPRVPLRIVRFLEPDGSTVWEAFWEAPAGHRSAVWAVRPGHAPLAETVRAGAVRMALAVEPGATVGLQLERAVRVGGVERWRPAAVGYEVAGPALERGRAVQLSDPLPFRADDAIREGELLRRTIGRGMVEPIYGADLAGLNGVGLYLEAYLDGVEGPLQIRYRIDTRRRGRLFRPSAAATDTFQFLREVEGPVLPIAFLVDRANWAGADEVDLHVEVEDLPTGAVARRSVSFTVD